MAPPSPPAPGPADRLLPPPDSATWPHRPLLLRRHPATAPTAGAAAEALPIHAAEGPFPVDTPLFQGIAVVRIRDAPGTAAPDRYFEGRARTVQMAVQGRFRRPLRMDEVFTGEALDRPCACLPHPLLCAGVLGLVRTLSPGIRIELEGPRPFAMSYLAATAQALRCDAPGAAPSVLDDVVEDTRRLGGVFATHNMPAKSRKRHLSTPAHAAEFYFTPDHVYTFDFFTDLLLPLEFQLALPMLGRLDLARYLDGQPIHFMAKHLPASAPAANGGEWLWCLELWHERLLPRRRRPSADPLPAPHDPPPRPPC